MQKLEAVFYRSGHNAEPVRDWLKELGKPACTLIGADMGTVQRGWPIGMPTCRAMGGGLFEVRTGLPDGRVARVLFCVDRGTMFLLHGFIKKTQKTPKSDLAIALERKRNLGV